MLHRVAKGIEEGRKDAPEINRQGTQAMRTGVEIQNSNK